MNILTLWNIIGVIFQLVVMIIDLVLIAIVVILYYEYGLIGFIISAILVYLTNKPLGGLFNSWRPSVIHAFLSEWKRMGEQRYGKRDI